MATTEYKDTEIGRIPREWELSLCEQICETITVGIVINPSSYYQQEGIPALRSFNVKEDRIDFSNLVYVSNEANNSILKKSKLIRGDVLVVRTGYPGTSCVLPQELDGANCIDILIARPKARIIDSRFLSRYLNSFSGKKQTFSFLTGIAQKHLNVQSLQKIQIPLPPLPEQKKIAEILSTVDTALEKVEQSLGKTKKLKNGLMQRLFTQGIGHKNFKDTEVGRIPMEWESTKLGNVANLIGGYAFKSKTYTSSGVRLLKISNISFGQILWEDKSFLPQNYNEKYKDFLIKPGDLVMAMTRPVVSGGIKLSRVGYDDCPCLMNQRVGKFVIKERIVPDFLLYILFDERFINSIIGGAYGSQQPNISSKQIESIFIPLPPLPEQKKIAEILSTVDKRLELLNRKKQIISRIKQWLMDVLFTGQKRVTQMIDRGGEV